MVMKAFFDKNKAALGLLTAALAVGVTVTLLQLVFSVDIYRDAANVYAFMARALSRREYAEAFHPAIPCLNVILAQPFIRLGLRPEQALSAVSSLFYLATIPCLYMLLKRFVPATPAAFGALLFACASKIIRFSCTSVIDSGKIFFLIAALYFVSRMADERFRSYKSALWLGAALGGMSLARSEGIGNAFVICGCLWGIWLYRSFREKRMMPIGPSAAPLVPWALAILARMWINWRFCGKFVFDERIHNGICKLFGRVVSAPAVQPVVSVWLPPPRRPVSWLELVNNFIRGCGEVYFGFAMAGILLLVLATYGGKLRILWPDKKIPEFFKWRGFYFVLLASAFGNALIFKLSTIGAYRYFLPNVPLFMIFVVVAAYWLWSWSAKLFPRPLRILCGMAVAGGLALQVVNGTENIFSRNSRRQYRSGVAAGDAMRREDPRGRVWFNTAGIEWYYTDMRRAVPIETSGADIWKYDFDFLLIVKDNTEEVEIPRVVNGLAEIELPADSTVRLFRRIKVK